METRTSIAMQILGVCILIKASVKTLACITYQWHTADFRINPYCMKAYLYYSSHGDYQFDSNMEYSNQLSSEMDGLSTFYCHTFDTPVSQIYEFQNYTP